MSASAQYNNVKGRGSKLRRVCFRFFPQGSSAPTFTAAQCPEVSAIDRSSQGLFLVTLNTTFKQLRGFATGVQSVSAAARYCQLGTISNLGTSSNITLQVRIVDGAGAVQDITGDANSSVSVELTFNDSEA